MPSEQPSGKTDFRSLAWSALNDTLKAMLAVVVIHLAIDVFGFRYVVTIYIAFSLVFGWMWVWRAAQ